MADYRYRQYGFKRRRRPPRDREFCKGCGVLVGIKALDDKGLCGSCELQSPLFDIPNPRTEQQS